MFAHSEFGIALAAVILFLVITIGAARVVISDIQKRVRMLWRIEAKLDLLLRHAGIEFDPYKNLPREVASVLQRMAASEANSWQWRKERIRAIQFYRQATGAGIKNSRDFIDEVRARGSWQ